MLANHKNMSNENSSTKTPLSVVKFLELVRAIAVNFGEVLNENIFSAFRFVAATSTSTRSAMMIW